MFQNRGLNHVAPPRRPPAPARRGAPSSVVSVLVSGLTVSGRNGGSGVDQAAPHAPIPSRVGSGSHLGINGILEPTKQTGLARRVPAGGRPPPTCPLPYERARSLPARVPDGARHADERVLGEGSGSLRLRSAVARNARALLRRGWTAFRLQSGVDGK